MCGAADERFMSSAITGGRLTHDIRLDLWIEEDGGFQPVNLSYTRMYEAVVMFHIGPYLGDCEDRDGVTDVKKEVKVAVLVFRWVYPASFNIQRLCSAHHHIRSCKCLKLVRQAS